MKIALAQLQLSNDENENFSKALKSIEESAKSGTELLCFPELQLSPFFPQYPKQANQDVKVGALNIDSPKLKELQAYAKAHQLVLVPNFYWQENNQYFDASPLINSDGSILGISKMVHIVQTHQFYEQDYYSPSDSGFRVYTTPIGKIGIVVCFDRHFPESIRSCALQGAELIIIPTANTQGEPLELFEWELRVSAMQNNVFIAMCNRVGLEGDMDFCGESLVIDPNGNVISKANDQEQMLYADLDLKQIEKSREQRPFLKLRRPEAYQST